MSEDSADQRSLGREIALIGTLAAPITLAQVGLVTIGLVEVAILGHATPADLGGASLGRSLGFVGLGFGIGAAAALEPLAAQAIGAREPHTAWRAFRSTLVAGALLAIPSILFTLASTWFLAPLGVAPELIAPARAFAFACAPGILLASVFFAAKSYLQAQKRTLPGIGAAIAANVVNLFVCTALVLGDDGLARVGLPRLGLRPLGALGAGIANTVANGVLAAWVVVPAWRARPRDAAPEGSAVPIRKVLRLGLPIGLQWLAEIGVFSFVAVLAGRLGTVAISAHQIAIGLSSVTFMGVLGIAGATSVRVGHAIGEGRSPRRSGVVGIAMGAAFMVLCGLGFVSAPGLFVGWFTNDAAIAELAARLVLIAAAFQLFDGIQGVAAGALRGAGDVRVPFAAIVGAHWLLGLPLAMYLGLACGLGAPGLWWGLLCGLAAVAVFLTWRFLVITRKTIGRV